MRVDEQIALPRTYNEPAKDYRHIRIEPVSGALGAEVANVDLADGLAPEIVAELRRALLDHLVLFVRGQSLDPPALATLGRRFGALHVHPFAQSVEGHPDVLAVHKEAADRHNFGGEWHADVTWSETPPLGAILHAREVPPWGGDTLFANQYMAYDMLSIGLKRLLEPLRAVHSAARVYSRAGIYAQDEFQEDGTQVRPSEAAMAEVLHPVVRTHPETGRKALFVNGAYVVRFEDMSVEESRPLIDYLVAHAVRPAFTCRLRWEAGAVAFWDNRCTLHNAINDYPGRRRVMYRVAIVGERPV